MMKIESTKTISRSRSSSSSSDDDDVHSSYSSSDSDLSLIETSAMNAMKLSQQRKVSVTSTSLIAQGTILRDTNNNFWMIHQCLQVSHHAERFLYLCSQVKRSTTIAEEHWVKTKISPLNNSNEQFPRSRHDRRDSLFYGVTIGESNKEIEWPFPPEPQLKKSPENPKPSIEISGNEIVRGIVEFQPSRTNKFAVEIVFLQEKKKSARIENAVELIEEILKELRRKNAPINAEMHKFLVRKRFGQTQYEIRESFADDGENGSSAIETSTSKFLLKLELVPSSTTTRRKKHFTIDDEIAFYSRFATHEKLKSYVKRHGLMYIAIPEYIAHGTYKHLNSNWKFLVLEQYRENLRSLIYSYDQSLPEHNALNLFLQMLYVIQYLHEKNHVHQIIKPKYMMFANKQPYFIYLTQFRTVRSVHETNAKANEVPNENRPIVTNENVHSKQQNHQVKKKVKRSHRTQLAMIQNKTASIVPSILPVIDVPSPVVEEEQSLNPNPPYFHPFSVYSSLDVHLHDKQTYRGDLEMLGYNLIVWSGGQLPWEKKNHRYSMKFQRETITNEKKLARSNVNEFVKKCFFMKLISPVTLRAICDYLSTVYQMNIDDLPNFDQLRAPIKEIVKALGFKANACLRLSNSKSKTTNQLNSAHAASGHSSAISQSVVKNARPLTKHLAGHDLNSPVKELEVERDDLDDEDETEGDEDDEDEDEDEDDEDHPCPAGSVSCEENEDETSTDEEDDEDEDEEEDVQMEQQAPSISGSSINQKCKRCGGDHSLEDQQSQTSSDKQSNSSAIASSNNHSNSLTYQQKRQRSIAKRLQLRRKKKN